MIDPFEKPISIINSNIFIEKVYLGYT